MTSERLPRLPRGEGLWTDSGKPVPRMQRLWEELCENIEAGRSRMDDILTQTVYADHTGAVTPSSQLPKTIAAKRYFNEADVTSSSSWSIAVRSGSATVSIGASTGIISITAVAAASSVIRVTSVRNSLTLYKDFTITRLNSAPPSSGGGGGTTGSDSTFNTINSTTHAVIAEFSVTTGSAGAVELAAPLSVFTDAAAPPGSFEVYGIWRYDNAGVWTDLGTEVASDPDCTVIQLATEEYDQTEGTLSVSYNHTGLAASTAYNYRLYARNASGTRQMSFAGTASGVGS